MWGPASGLPSSPVYWASRETQFPKLKLLIPAHRILSEEHGTTFNTVFLQTSVEGGGCRQGCLDLLWSGAMPAQRRCA